MKKLVHLEDYRGIRIKIEAEYTIDDHLWINKVVDTVTLYYKYYNKDNESLIKDYGITTIAKPSPKKILFWTINPKKTFYELVDEELNDTIKYMKSQIDKSHIEMNVTNGLMESLKEIH